MRMIRHEMACLIGVALCATIGLGVAHAQSGTGTSAASASRQTEANRAFKLLASTLTSNCGTGSYFEHTQTPDSVPKVVKTSSVRVQDGILSVERVDEGIGKTYRVRLGDLRPSADRRPQTALVGGDLSLPETRSPPFGGAEGAGGEE